MTVFRSDAAQAAALDRDDPLATFRARFHLPQHTGRDEIYLCGNSLGLQPRSTERHMREELEDWQRLGVKGHFDGRRPWMPYHEFFAEGTARVVGAKPAEVVNMNSLTVNLHLMMTSFYRPTPKRHKIVIERGAFPSDRYAVESQIRLHGLDPDTSLIELTPGEGRSHIEESEIEALLAADGSAIALLMLPGVQYYSGQVFDMARITQAGHAVGCMVGFDLAHAVGNLPLKLHDWDMDFAVWCNYKYMNAGPGAVAGCFVHERHARDFDRPRLAGWWGHEKQTRFRMGPEFVPMAGAEGWQLSNPSVFGLAPLLASLEIFDEAGMERLRTKSLQLTAYLEFLLKEKLSREVEILTPADPARRGCQLSLRLHAGRNQARRVFERLEAAGVTGDWREPDVIRVAPVPLYNSYADVFGFVDILAGLVAG
ncbi:MAG TPA: kynureninase [Gammaproteobacteria bacterium]|jgi:kynureninase|nr:kynureninase [Gammaproteobacteria bacterium]